MIGTLKSFVKLHQSIGGRVFEILIKKGISNFSHKKLVGGKIEELFQK